MIWTINNVGKVRKVGKTLTSIKHDFRIVLLIVGKVRKVCINFC